MSEEYIVASVKIPIRIRNRATEPLQDRCQIEFYRCATLDDFPLSNSLEAAELMNNFSQFFNLNTNERVVDDVREQQDTGVMPQDTGFIPKETGVIPQDTGFIPKDTGFIPKDTGFIPKETGFIPKDTGVIPKDTGVIPKDTAAPKYIQTEKKTPSNHRTFRVLRRELRNNFTKKSI